MSADPENTISPDDQLPPVEPPSAGFVVQLFVIPALIVLIMFLVGAGITLLVEKGVLEVRIPKPERRKPRRVAISVGDQPETIEGSAGDLSGGTSE